MRAAWSNVTHRLEALEPRRLLSLPAGGGVEPDPQLIQMMLEADVSAPHSSATAAYWRDAGALHLGGLPVNASVRAVAGRTFEFTRASFERTLPLGLGGEPQQVLLPTPTGGLARFAIEQTALLAPHVAAQNPTIFTFRGVGMDDPAAVTQFDLTENGFHATVLSPRGMWAVSPVVEYAPDVRAGGGLYASYFIAHVLIPAHELDCDVDHDHALHDHDHDHDHHEIDRHDHDHDDDLDHDDDHVHAGPALSPDAPTGPIRYQMRLAVAANGEWTAEAGGTASSGFATIVTAVNAADLLYNREFNVGFTLVSGTEIVYTDPATDPYTNSSGSTMLGENQVNLDNVIGDANYDIGHVFTRSGGGVANLGVVGRSGWKARGVSGNSPTSFAYQVTFRHEMGHQFGASHTWNHTNSQYSSQRAAHSAYEPGPGSTIMSYGGFSFFPGNFVPMRDQYFHARSHEQVSNYLLNSTWGPLAGTQIPTGNVAPTVNAGINRTIPARTPFELAGSASHPAALSYVWEQWDLGAEIPIGIDNGTGPLFRSRPATPQPTRLMPELADILANRSDPDETLPQLSRIADPLTFRLTALDGQGAVGSAIIDLTVIDTGAAFAISSHNSTGTSWDAGSMQTVTWNVAGTAAAQFNAANVSIYLSYNSGVTFIPVLSGVPNNGSATFVVPHTAPNTFNARVMVKPDDNIFFDINNAPIRIFADTELIVDSFYFAYETSHAVGIRFGEPIDLSTLTIDDLTVQHLTGGTTIPASHFSLAAVPGSNQQDFWFTYNPPGTAILADGNYRATIPAGSVADLAGNTLANDLILDFFVLAGDANRDGAVNLADFNILAANFGQSPRTFSQGDFNFDGVVNLADFNILASQFGMSLGSSGLLSGGGERFAGFGGFGQSRITTQVLEDAAQRSDHEADLPSFVA